jgi:hypothetical protein
VKNTKTCCHCGEQNDAAEFPANRRKRDGLSSWCRACHAEACAKWRAEHPEKVNVYNRRRRAEYAAIREAEHEAARKALNKALREQVRRNRERDERLREQRRKAAT